MKAMKAKRSQQVSKRLQPPPKAFAVDEFCSKLQRHAASADGEKKMNRLGVRVVRRA